MMKQKNYEKSPFAKNTYDGVVNQKTTIAYHPTKEFKKILDKFFDNKFGDASDNEIMDQIVKDYFYRYSHEKGFYGKTLIALVSTKDLDEMHERNNLDALRIVPIVVLDRYAKNHFYADDFLDAEIVDEVNEYGAMIYDKVISLKNGLNIGVLEFGDLNSNEVVFYLHGFPGCRYEPLFTEK